MLPILIILAVNIIGYVLKSFELDRYIIFLGFRFHLVTTFPILILFNKEIFAKIKEYFKQINLKNGWYPLFVIFITVVVIPIILYFTNLTKYTDPDFLYELGASSIIDYPVYLIWNLPQLLIFTAYLYYITQGRKLKFLIVFFITIFSFAYEFIPLNNSVFVYNDIFILALAALLIAMCSIRLNIYLSSIIMISVFWGHILVFGNFSLVLLNLLLAKNFNVWEGILKPDKSISNYILIIQLCIAIILFLPTLLLNSNRKK